MNKTSFLAATIVATSMAALASMALAAQDRYTLKIPNGPSFADFKGYENWQYVAVSQTEDGLKIIAANPTMMKAYRSGIPDNGKKFPEGSKIVKIEWSQKKETTPYFVVVPERLKSVSFIEKDSKRFKSSDGWGYAQFQYEAAAGTFKAMGSDATCGHACHTAVKVHDFIFTAYPQR